MKIARLISGIFQPSSGRGVANSAEAGDPQTNSRWYTANLVLVIATLWMATRPYVGIIHDSRFYTLQALSAMLPGRFADDLYFRYGSQDQFTVFTLIYEPAIAALGMARAAMVLTILGQLFWTAALIYLARAIFRDGRMALVAVAMAIALPGGVILSYGEQFVTPRLFSEALSLGALGAMLRNQPGRALLILILSATVHPLMTLPCFGVLFLYQAAERRVWWLLAVAAVIAAIGLALCGIKPFARLTDRFDPAWFAVVRVRDFFCLITKWPIYQWLRVINMFFLGVLGFRISDRRQRRFIGAVFAVAIGGLFATLVGGDILNNVLIVDAQQYRATWLLAVVANLLVAPTLFRMRKEFDLHIKSYLYVSSVIILLIAIFFDIFYFVATPLLGLACLAAVLEGKRQVASPHSTRIVGAIIIGVTIWASLGLLFAYVEWLKNAPDLVSQAARGIGLAGAALGILGLNVATAAARYKAARQWTAAAAATLVLLGAYGWDQRNSWTRFIETTAAPPESLLSLLPRGKSIYWEGDVRLPWFLLRQPSYFSCEQGTGALFFRGTAITYQHRFDSFEPLQTLDFGKETTCPAMASTGAALITRMDMVTLCAREPDLDTLVLTRPAADVMARIWKSPVAFEYPMPKDSGMQVFSTDRFYIYYCDDFRK